jgi:hypothetical protein
MRVALSRGRHYSGFGSVQMVPDMLPILNNLEARDIDNQ